MTDEQRAEYRVGTHDKAFHADDAFAVAVLRGALAPAGVTLVRTRDPEKLAACHVVVDVGGGYSVDQGRVILDHHQRGGAGARPDGFPYAAFGLAWKHYGAAYVLSVTACSQSEAAAVADRVDRNLVRWIDASDCGYRPLKEAIKRKQEVVRQRVPDDESEWTIENIGEYHYLRGLDDAAEALDEGNPPYSVSLAISQMNPAWDEPQDDDRYNSDFADASTIAGIFLERSVRQTLAALRAEKVVLGRLDWSEDPQILVLAQPVPWKDVVCARPEAAGILYVVFPRTSDPHTDWLCQCVPPAPGSFEKKKALPETWAGLPGDKLAELTGVADAVFCHPGRWICGAKTLAGAKRLAVIACCS